MVIFFGIGSLQGITVRHLLHLSEFTESTDLHCLTHDQLKLRFQLSVILRNRIFLWLVCYIFEANVR